MRFWDYIEERLKDYHRNADVLKCDLLTRFLDGESLSEDDLEFIERPKCADEALRYLYFTELGLLRKCFREEWVENVSKLKRVKK